VIGGKLSEGINFSDDLARTVIVFGLPYPNNQAAAIKEKMKFYDEYGPEDFKGRHYYENLCMRTVNQAIGRALRHAKDYACIVLADSRLLSKPETLTKFPKWI
jgi:chromosome transmission fidelity protein 1